MSGRWWGAGSRDAGSAGEKGWKATGVPGISSSERRLEMIERWKSKVDSESEGGEEEDVVVVGGGGGWRESEAELEVARLAELLLLRLY